MKIQAYLSFKGNCQKALDYYQSIFGGKIVNRQDYSDEKIDIPEHYRNKLQHAELKGDGFHIMAYDASPDTPITDGTNIQMSIDLENEEKAKNVFHDLANQGKIQTEFQKTNWGAHYGRVTDQFGINWMINAK